MEPLISRCAPVLFLIYNRPATTAQVFRAIERAKPRYLFVAADGPRSDRSGDYEKCQAARAVVSQISWPCEVQVLFRDENLGCRAAVSSAIDWFFSYVEEGLILEDDTLPADSFFPFCTEILERYRFDNRIMMISGDNFQNGARRGDASYYFSRIFHIWGWATWRRAWSLYDTSIMNDVVSAKKHIECLFNDKNIRLSWEHIFKLMYYGHVDTWDYLWALTCLMQNGLSVVPNVNMVSNVGFGIDGTHTTDADSVLANIDRHEIAEIKHADCIYCNVPADLHEYANIYPTKEKMSLFYRIKRHRKAQKLHKKIRDISVM